MGDDGSVEVKLSPTDEPLLLVSKEWQKRPEFFQLLKNRPVRGLALRQGCAGSGAALLLPLLPPPPPLDRQSAAAAHFLPPKLLPMCMPAFLAWLQTLWKQGLLVTFITCAAALLVGLAALYALHCHQAARFTPLADLRQLCATWRLCLCWGGAGAAAEAKLASVGGSSAANGSAPGDSKGGNTLGSAGAGKTEAAALEQREDAEDKEDGAVDEAVETAMATLMSGLGLGEKPGASAVLCRAALRWPVCLPAGWEALQWLPALPAQPTA